MLQLNFKIKFIIICLSFQNIRIRNTITSIYNLDKIKFVQHKITLPQLKKYDITQKVIQALADAESRAIIFSIIRKGKTASNLSDSLKIPLSSVYKKLADLEALTLIKVEKTILAENGKRFKIYKSRINRAEISINKPEPTLKLSAN